MFRIGGNTVNEEVRGSTGSLQNSAAAAVATSHQQQEQGRKLNEAGREEQQLPSVPASTMSSGVDEPRRPVRLLGEDGRVTETLNASE